MGAWSWGVGGNGGDRVFGNTLTKEDLWPVFRRGMELGLNLWDTAAVYGMGASETILGEFVDDCDRDDLYISTKFTPQIAKDVEHPTETMMDESLKRLHTDYVDLYWIHNPADVERLTKEIIPVVKSGKARAVGVSNHNLEEIKRAEEILSAEGLHVAAVQNHYSLLHRSSERAGILDYSKKRASPSTLTWSSNRAPSPASMTKTTSCQKEAEEERATTASWTNWTASLQP